MRIQVNNPVVRVILKIIGWKCWCKKRTRIFNDNEGYYVRCLQCGRRMPYDWAALGTLKCANPEREDGHEAQHSWSGEQAVDPAS